MAITLTLNSEDFSIAYNASTNSDEIGYTGATTNVFGRLNAEFRVDPISAQSLTFDNVGDTKTLAFGTAILREDYIAHQPRLNELLPNGSVNTTDYPDFSFSVDRDHPEELALTVNVMVDGVATPLQFQSIPEVQSGPPGFAFSPPFNRADPAPTTLPGSTGDADVDFRAEFAPVSFEVNGYRFTADISDILFTQPIGPGDTGAGTNTPVDVESISLVLRLDAAPPPDITKPDVTINIVDTALSNADKTSQVTFTFSETIAAGTFTLDDVSAVNGTLSNLVFAGDNTSATATFTATADVSGTGSVAVTADKFTDVAGNLNNASNTDTVTIDTRTPNAVDDTPLVDDVFYLAHNPDVLAAGVDPDVHYAAFGWHEGRDPDAFFSTNGYLSANADVNAAHINPLEHYHQNGWKEGRDASINFDTTLYLQHNPDVKAAGIDPLEHYLAFGRSEGRQAYEAVGLNVKGAFDAEYYLLANPDVGAAGIDPLTHYNTFGWKEGRDPNAFFDTSAYLSTYSDVAAAGVNPLEHYMSFGWHEGRDPSGKFDT
uniref:Ig-like domain-containing protein n=1 Tax=Microvirga calopogonii TaxID=2078013 RepID=UPI001FE1FD30